MPDPDIFATINALSAEEEQLYASAADGSGVPVVPIVPVFVLATVFVLVTVFVFKGVTLVLTAVFKFSLPLLLLTFWFVFVFTVTTLTLVLALAFWLIRLKTNNPATPSPATTITTTRIITSFLVDVLPGGPPPILPPPPVRKRSGIVCTDGCGMVDANGGGIGGKLPPEVKPGVDIGGLSGLVWLPGKGVFSNIGSRG